MLRSFISLFLFMCSSLSSFDGLWGKDRSEDVLHLKELEY